ncbi:3' [Umbelopsis nana]
MANNFVRPSTNRRRLATWRIDQLLRPKDIFALLIASIGHDVGHPGVNNMFMINISNPLALLYNDRSVLESFHSMALFQIITKHKFVDTHGPEYMEFRKTVVHSILATDMGLHADYVAKINEQLKRLRTKGLDLSDHAACEQERLIICGALIKCADIGNCTRPFMEAKRWAEVLSDEFSNQGDLERELGLPVLPVNDRGKMTLEDFQLGFIRHIAINLFQAVANVIPEMSFCVDYMQQNAKIWESRKHEGGHDSGVGDSLSEKEDADRLSHIPTIEESAEDNDSNMDDQSSCGRSSIHKPRSAHLMYPDSSNANGRLMVTSPKLYPEYKNPSEHDHPYIQHSDPVRGYNIIDPPVLIDKDKASLQDKPVHSSLRSRWRQRRNLDALCQCSIQ